MPTDGQVYSLFLEQIKVVQMFCRNLKGGIILHLFVDSYMIIIQEI